MRLVAMPAPVHDDVTKTFAALTRREQALLWLAYVEEYSHLEIGRALELSRGAVKALLFRTRAKLRDQLIALDEMPSTRSTRLLDSFGV